MKKKLQINSIRDLLIPYLEVTFPTIERVTNHHPKKITSMVTNNHFPPSDSRQTSAKQVDILSSNTGFLSVLRKKIVQIKTWLVVEPTHLINMLLKLGSSSPIFGMGNKK